MHDHKDPIFEEYIIDVPHLPSSSIWVKENVIENVVEISVTQTQLHYMACVCDESRDMDVNWTTIDNLLNFVFLTFIAFRIIIYR